MKFVKLNEVCDLKNGFAFKSKDYVEISDTLSCRMSSIRPGGNFDLHHNQRFLPNEYANLYSDYLLKDGDIVIAMTDLAGDPKILGVPTIVRTEGKFLLQNQRVGRLIIKDTNQVFVPYLQYALNRPENKSYYKKFAGGGLQINVGKKEILGNKIPLPKLETQKKIATILDEADKVRTLNKQLIAKYDALTQSLFLEMFGDIGVSNKKEDFIQLKELIIQKPDNGFFAKKNFYNSDGVPIVWLNNFIDKIYIEQRNLRRAVILPKDEKYALEYGDALFCRSSLTAEGIGKCAIVPKKLKEKTLFECHIIRLKLNIDKVIPEYFRFLSDTKYFRANIEKRAKTSTMTTISQDGITDIKIPVPPIKLQNQFAERLTIIENQKQQAQDSLQKSEDLFNSLLQKAFKGALVK